MSYLSQEQATQIGQLLRERRRTLRNEIREGLLKSGETRHKDMAGMVSDAGDESVANMLQDVKIAEVERDMHELREVEGALARIDRSDFGGCVDCGEAIGYSRLQVSPAAVRCHACQERRERSYAHESTHRL